MVRSRLKRMKSFLSQLDSTTNIRFVSKDRLCVERKGLEFSAPLRRWNVLRFDSFYTENEKWVSDWEKKFESNKFTTWSSLTLTFWVSLKSVCKAEKKRRSMKPTESFRIDTNRRKFEQSECELWPNPWSCHKQNIRLDDCWQRWTLSVMFYSCPCSKPRPMENSEFRLNILQQFRKHVRAFRTEKENHGNDGKNERHFPVWIVLHRLNTNQEVNWWPADIWSPDWTRFPIQDRTRHVVRFVGWLCPFPRRKIVPRTVIETILFDRLCLFEFIWTHIHETKKLEERSKTMKKIFTQFWSKFIRNNAEQISRRQESPWENRFVREKYFQTSNRWESIERVEIRFARELELFVKKLIFLGLISVHNNRETNQWSFWTRCALRLNIAPNRRKEKGFFQRRKNVFRVSFCASLKNFDRFSYETLCGENLHRKLEERIDSRRNCLIEQKVEENFPEKLEK